ncbi:MAG: helix-hairpin-helix domain-containing protein [Candidatus Pacebacteria bacterium]|nr:helix-hairpin-helix domain-containing protein [Candidatus Paceibacterota bacterium]
MYKDKKTALRELQSLPNIGPKCASMMYDAGVVSVAHFEKLGAEKTYNLCCKAQGHQIHRAFLYVLRSAHYFLDHPHQREKVMRWWMWKDITPIKKKIIR